MKNIGVAKKIPSLHIYESSKNEREIEGKCEKERDRKREGGGGKERAREGAIAWKGTVTAP